MTAMDKAGIGIAIGITIVAVAFAGAGTNLQSEGPGGSPFVAPPMTQPAMEKEESMASQKTMEQMMKEQREQFTEGTGDAKVSAPRVEDVGPQTVEVLNAHGSSVPGCEETNECFIPHSVTIHVGDTVSWINDDTAAHTATSGTPTAGPDGAFDSGLVLAGSSFSHTFDAAGEYPYFCMVHPWMVGDVTVN